ncbi:GNAT family N-acetyltransferase [Bacteroides sp.]
MILKGKLVTLRPVELEDIEFIREMVNDPWMESLITGWAFPISKKDQQEWYAQFHNSDKQLRYIIETEVDGAVGFTGLRNIDWKNGNAEGGGMRVARKENMSRGIATDAYMTLLRYAFYELRLNRVGDSVLDYNAASIKMTSKVGFKQEGVERESIYKNGQYYDKILLGILKSDYDKIVEETNYWDV